MFFFSSDRLTLHHILPRFIVFHSHCPFVATALPYLWAANRVRYLVVANHLCPSLATRKSSFRTVTMLCTGEANQQESSVWTNMPYKGALCPLLERRLVCAAPQGAVLLFLEGNHCASMPLILMRLSNIVIKSRY